jgi:hypothetical protein
MLFYNCISHFLYLIFISHILMSERSCIVKTLPIVSQNIFWVAAWRWLYKEAENMSLIWSFNCLLITLYIIKVVSEGTIIYTLLSSFKCCTSREKEIGGYILLPENCVLSLFHVFFFFVAKKWVGVYFVMFTSKFYISIQLQFLCRHCQ